MAMHNITLFGAFSLRSGVFISQIKLAFLIASWEN